MSGFILGKKSIQGQTFDEEGNKIPTTYIRTSSCYLIDVKRTDKIGYFAVKLGIGATKNIKKTVKGEIEKAGIKAPLRFLREIRLEKFGDKVKPVEENGKTGVEINGNKVMIGEEIKAVSLFKKGDMAMVSGQSKGKGFQGVVKRHGFHGGSRTHGQSHGERAPGSIGMTTTPGRIFKGKRMAGRMGNNRVSIKNLKVVNVDDEGLVVKGMVPGGKNGLLEVRVY